MASECTVISSDRIAVTVSSRGAELQSIKDRDGVEFLWQGDPAYWTSHAPNIFPYVARLTEGKYLFHGKEYGFGNHGLVRYEDLRRTEVSPSAVSYELEADAETLKKYPFDFRYRIRYETDGSRLKIQTVVWNKGSGRMFFAVGGHPGFNVPIGGEGSFADYFLEFAEEARPYRIFLADSGAVTPRQEVFSMEENRRFALRHDLFDHDAVVLHHACDTVTLKCGGGRHAVTVSYPDFRYVGFWHKPGTDAPYLCIEPWTSLPSREGIVENLAYQADLIRLDPQQSWTANWWMEVR